MGLTVAIQMDPIDGIDIDADSTFVLALEAERRGHALLHYLPQDLALADGRVVTRARPLSVRRRAGDHFTLGPAEPVDLADVDIVLMRQDPPFDMAYVTATHLLERIHPATSWSTTRRRCATRRRSCSSSAFPSSCRRP